MSKLALALVTMLATTTVADQAAADWRTDHQLHMEDFERAYPRGGYSNEESSKEYSSSQCGWFCKTLVTGGVLAVAAAVAEYQKAEREKRLRASAGGAAPAR